MENRKPYIKTWQELSEEKNMVFLAGPRQAGKTTLCRIVSDSFSNHMYFNWDIAEDRAKFLEKPNFFTEIERKDASLPLIIFDEIHKYKGWRNLVKGFYDTQKASRQFLITDDKVFLRI